MRRPRAAAVWHAAANSRERARAPPPPAPGALLRVAPRRLLLARRALLHGVEGARLPQLPRVLDAQPVGGGVRHLQVGLRQRRRRGGVDLAARALVGPAHLDALHLGDLDVVQHRVAPLLLAHRRRHLLLRGAPVQTELLHHRQPPPVHGLGLGQARLPLGVHLAEVGQPAQAAGPAAGAAAGRGAAAFVVLHAVRQRQALRVRLRRGALPRRHDGGVLLARLFARDLGADAALGALGLHLQHLQLVALLVHGGGDGPRLGVALEAVGVQQPLALLVLDRDLLHVAVFVVVREGGGLGSGFGGFICLEGLCYRNRQRLRAANGDVATGPPASTAGGGGRRGRTGSKT